MNEKQKSIAKKITLAWKKWNDPVVKEAEKDVIAETIRKMLDKYELSLDWKTGKVTATKQEAPKKEAKKKRTKQGMSTKDVITLIFETYGDEWTGKQLRRKIRQMEKWDDGKMTHYDFTPEDVKEILEYLGYEAS